MIGHKRSGLIEYPDEAKNGSIRDRNANKRAVKGVICAKRGKNLQLFIPTDISKAEMLRTPPPEMTHDQLKTETTMELKNAHRHHRVQFIVKVALRAATLIAAGLAVHELDRINHRLKKIEKREHRHLL